MKLQNRSVHILRSCTKWQYEPKNIAKPIVARPLERMITKPRAPNLSEMYAKNNVPVDRVNGKTMIAMHILAYKPNGVRGDAEELSTCIAKAKASNN